MKPENCGHVGEVIPVVWTEWPTGRGTAIVPIRDPETVLVARRLDVPVMPRSRKHHKGVEASLTQGDIEMVMFGVGAEVIVLLEGAVANLCGVGVRRGLGKEREANEGKDKRGGENPPLCHGESITKR